MNNLLKKIRKTSERGQAIILIAFALVGMVAIVGLMIDGGILLIEYARLKRGIDAASIAAASQFRKGFVGADMRKAGEEFLQFNQSVSEVQIYTCDYPGTSHLEELCPPFAGPTRRKLVRVTASRYVDFGFMRVIGMNGTTIRATAVGEAASIDMVLVMDTSTSMAYETKAGGDPLHSDPALGPDLATDNQGDNPEFCNINMGNTHRCEPLGKVIDAAVSFVDELFYPYDRVAVVATTGQTGVSNVASREPVTVMDFNDNYVEDNNPATNDETTEIQAAIRSLRVYQPNRCQYPLTYNVNDPTNNPTNTVPCLNFRDQQNASAPVYYRSQNCPPKDIGYDDGTGTGTRIKDPSTCGPSNIGGGLYEAGYQFAAARQNSFWVVIALFGGPVNAFNPLGDEDRQCPTSTWDLSVSAGGGGSGYCRDEDIMPGTYNAATYNPAPVEDGGYDWSPYVMNDTNSRRHRFTINTATDPDTTVYPAAYNADDYARDGADYITSPTTGTTSSGQGATLFSICMGSYCRGYPNTHDPASAELLGRYMALEAGNQYNALGARTFTANHGLYYYAEQASDLGGPNGVFAKIAENIFTRISQ